MSRRGLLELPDLPPVRIRRHPRAKRLILRVREDGEVVLTLPRRATLAEAEHFVARQADWILDAAAEAASPVEIPETVRFELTSETVEIHTDPDRERGAKETDGRLILPGADGNHWQAALLTWYLKRARRTLPPMLRRLSLDTGLAYKRTQVRRQRSRWGSCSATGTISLNAGLLFQPPEIARYLMLHELCHTRHMDHSPRFYTLLARLEPAWERLDQELMAEGRGRIPRWAR